ncbi:MAG TPA: hypothetical protein VK463_16245 [Desulfomonilaceae bacterium]|nr:hypothetical protein [Desulfomonilaceae bacterium]
MAAMQTALARSIHRVSAGGRYFYTEFQLYYELCRTVRPFLKYLSAIPFALPRPIDYFEFSEILKRHVTYNGKPAGLLTEPVSWVRGFIGREPDLADYGLTRLLVCTDPHIATMLIANHMHMELGCAILSMSDALPLPDMICAMLARAADSQVYVLHDSDLHGIMLFRHARVRLQLPEPVTALEVGLRPFQCLKMHLFFHRTDSWAHDEIPVPSDCTVFEKAWMKAGLKTEIACIPPVALFRLLRRRLISGR